MVSKEGMYFVDFQFLKSYLEFLGLENNTASYPYEIYFFFKKYQMFKESVVLSFESTWVYNVKCNQSLTVNFMRLILGAIYDSRN